jgi:polar amino acid transport system substrate-binding protein
MRRSWILVLLLWCVGAHSAELRIAFGQSLAPYADEKTSTGLEIDIIRAAFNTAGHTVVPVFLPQARVPLAMRDAQFDGAATLTPDSGVVGSYSEVYVHYLDMVIAPKGQLSAPLQMADLQGLRVVGFQNASLYLGPEFAAMAKANPRYSELANQLSQTRMLFGRQADAIVCDPRIFEYQIEQLRQSGYTEKPFAVDLFAVFDEIPYRMVFRESALRDVFNAGLAQIRQSGALAQIEARYLRGKPGAAR